MLVDVVFPVFLPTKEWSQAFKALNYDTEKVYEKHGSPFVSNQIKDLKVRDGVYYTGLNSEHYFDKSGLEFYSPYSDGITPEEMHAFKEANIKNGHHELFGYFDLVQETRLKLFGNEEHQTNGVCDNEQQILDKWPHLLNSEHRHFITMTPIYKDHQSSHGGWRWHKWGDYIGRHEIQCEYLYDEEGIEVVYVFHIYTLKPESGLGVIPDNL